MPVFRVESLSRQYDRSQFSCGVSSLDRYLAQQASQDQAWNIATVFILVEVSEERIAGYYTLSASSIPLDDLPDALRKKLPRYREIPVALLGRLAVDATYRGRGLGGVLIADALEQVRSLQRYLATWAVVVDAIDNNASAFYEHFGFVRFPTVDNRLFLPLRSFRSAAPNDPGTPDLPAARDSDVDR